MPIQQKYFEMRDVPPLQGRAWIPLRQSAEVEFDPPEPNILRLEDYTGIATAAVETAKRADAEKLDWNDLDVNPHRAGVEQWGYCAADLFRTWSDGPLGIYLVIEQHLESESRHIWHLHPDMLIALCLLREGDSWYRPSEGWVEVARLKRDADGKPTLLEIKAEFLADYLGARGMALYCSSYRERIAVTADRPPYSWPDEQWKETHQRDQREALTVEATYPDPKGSFWTRGALWRTEWVEPGKISVRVRGDKEPHTTSFVLKSDGTRVTADQLAGTMSWLFFDPTLVSTLLRHRGAKLHWHSQDTGGLGATSSTVHFGVNVLGLITVFAKDIGRLPPWEQRLWSAHNVTPDGGVSKELFAAQMEVNPAATVAPESELSTVIEALNGAFSTRYAQPLLRNHESVPNLLRRAHRFQAAEADGLLELSKEVTRLFMERVDVEAVIAPLSMPKGERKPGSLKAIEKLVAHLRSETEAQSLMAPLFGIYDLRLADAHLGSGLVASGKMRASVCDSEPATMQGRQLLQTFVDTLRRITDVLA